MGSVLVKFIDNLRRELELPSGVPLVSEILVHKIVYEKLLRSTEVDPRIKYVGGDITYVHGKSKITIKGKV